MLNENISGTEEHKYCYENVFLLQKCRKSKAIERHVACSRKAVLRFIDSKSRDTSLQNCYRRTDRQAFDDGNFRRSFPVICTIGDSHEYDSYKSYIS